LFPTSTVVDCNASTLPVPHQPAETNKHVGEYKGSLISTRKLSATDLQRLADFIGSLSPVSRSFRFSSKIPIFDIATSIVANALKGSASYIPLVDDNGEIKGLGDIVPSYSRTLEKMYGGQGLVAIHDVKTFEINIVIADSFQGCGLGTELYRLTIGEAENSGYKQVYARVNAANRRAIKFCESVGMKKLSETADVVHYLRLLH
jgi:ribosomal protein S18 acetylase RimI-like enzyme